MADSDHSSHADNCTSLTDSILSLREKVNGDELPGFTDLITDWFDPKVDVDQEQFARRFLHVFKSSDKDFTYEKIIGDYDDELQGIFNDFVDGKINAHEAAQRYNPYKTQKLPRHIGDLRKGGLASLVDGDNNALEDHTSLLTALPSSIPSRIRSLIAKVIPATKNPKRALYVPVGSRAVGREPC